MIGCFFNPAPCIEGAATGFADAVLSYFPFGLYGLVFLAGMIVGERIGLWGIAVAIVGWFAIRFGSKQPAEGAGDDFVGDVDWPDAAPPVPSTRRPRQTILDWLRSRQKRRNR